MAKQVNTLAYLPEVVKGIHEFRALAAAVDPELSAQWHVAEAAFKDQFIETATEPGIKRYELMLGLSPKGTETLDERRFRLKAVYSAQRPFTIRALRVRLEALCGAGAYTLNVSGYTVTVRIELTAKSRQTVVSELLEHMVPLNMLIDLSLRYNTYKALSRFTHGQLSAYTHEQLRNEVMTNGGKDAELWP